MIRFCNKYPLSTIFMIIQASTQANDDSKYKYFRFSKFYISYSVVLQHNAKITLKVKGFIFERIISLFYLLTEASLIIHSIKLIKLIPEYAAISGTNESFVIPGCVLVSNK